MGIVDRVKEDFYQLVINEVRPSLTVGLAWGGELFFILFDSMS